MSLLCRIPGPVAAHTFGKEFAVGGRGVSNGVGPGVDGCHDALVRGTAGGDDRNIRELLADLADDLRGLGSAGYIQNVRAAGNALGHIHLAGDNGGDHRDVHNILDLGDRLIGDRGVDHHAEGPLMLSPTNTGTSDTLIMAWAMLGWGVKG